LDAIAEFGDPRESSTCAARNSRVGYSSFFVYDEIHETQTIPLTEILETAQIVRTPGVCGGKPRIEGDRIKVEHIAVCYERMGMTDDEIVKSHPTITLAQKHAALAYYFEHKQEIDADIEEGKRFVEDLKAKSPPSKLQKLLEARKANASDDSFPPG
jgi:uncharacterized protein (DUF433 family)